jgi:arylsulfatase
MVRSCSVALVVFAALGSSSLAADKPNIVFILADDLGWHDLGCYGQTKIRTPNVDRLAAEGIRLTRAYCGNAVCAPSRCCLMTGMHPGHAWVRDNRQWKEKVQWSGQIPLPENTLTLPLWLKQQGYATGAAGKWGLGAPENSGDPQKQGFDHFFGYYCQAHAHNHYPAYVFRDGNKVALEGNDGSATGKQFTQDLFEAEALSFIRAHRDRPFFLYVPFTVPHLAIQVPEDSLAEYRGKFDEKPYRGKAYQPHETPRAGYAAMVTRMDRSVGRITDLLKELGLDQRTLVIFASDNGPVGDYAGSDNVFFASRGDLHGWKGSLYEGGIRTPFVARWPGKIKAGTTSDVQTAFWDMLPTLCEVAGGSPPAGIDGISILPSLLGKEQIKTHDFLYWEFPSYGGQQAVHLGNWKGTRQNLQKGPSAIELYDLAGDPNEITNIAASHPDIVKQIDTIMKREHVLSAIFPLPSVDVAVKKK